MRVRKVAADSCEHSRKLQPASGIMRTMLMYRQGRSRLHNLRFLPKFMQNTNR